MLWEAEPQAEWAMVFPTPAFISSLSVVQDLRVHCAFAPFTLSGKLWKPMGQP